MKKLIAGLAWLFLSAEAFAQKEEVEAPDCFSVKACIAIVTDYEIKPPPTPDAYRSSGVDARPIRNAVQRLVSFGDPAVVALIDLLNHPNYYVQNRAAYTLFHFTEIDPRHLPALLAAHRSGIHWLEPAIASTKTDEALAYLWEDFLADPDTGSNFQTIRVLPLFFGKRLLPLIRNELKRCRTSDNYQLCGELLQLAWTYDPLPEFAISNAETIAASPGASEMVRRQALHYLIILRHPYGLAVLKNDLETAISLLNEYPADGFFFKRQRSDGSEDFWFAFELENTLNSIAFYEDAAKELGPLIVQLLARRDIRDVRAAAALTIGQIRYEDGVEALLAIKSDFDDDWYLAYNSIESLGRLQALNAKASVEKISREHWYRPVRNNAERAMASIDGRPFARTGIVGDSDPPSQEDAFPFSGAEMRYLGDFSEFAEACPPSRKKRYALFMPDRLSWPKSGGVEYDLSRPNDGKTKEFYAFHPDLRESLGSLEFVVDYGNRLIAGIDIGEFGGGVYAVDKEGRIDPLIPSNAIAAFKTNKHLLVTTGLSHLGMSTGDLWVVGVESGSPAVQRRIRLPLKPRSHETAFRETFVIKGDRGDVAIRSDGLLIDPTNIESCANISTSLR